MRIFVCDAFSFEIFKGNQAGVVILEEKEEYPTVTLIKNLKLDILLQQKKLNYVDMQQFQFFLF